MSLQVRWRINLSNATIYSVISWGKASIKGRKRVGGICRLVVTIYSRLSEAHTIGKTVKRAF